MLITVIPTVVTHNLASIKNNINKKNNNNYNNNTHAIMQPQVVS